MIINNPPQFKHELTCYHNYEGYKGEENDQDEDQSGVRCEGEGQRYGGECKGGSKRDDKKYVLGCVQDMLGNKKPLFQFEDIKKREMRYYSLLYLCEK